MSKEIDVRRIKDKAFVINNGKVMLTLNILPHGYNKLASIRAVLEDDGVDKAQFLDCVNFLSQEKYIALRDIRTEEPAALHKSDVDKLEAMITSKGIRLMKGGLVDNMIEV